MRQTNRQTDRQTVRDRQKDRQTEREIMYIGQGEIQNRQTSE